jgi:peptidyl-prolyl cis-trans isomerase D
MLESMRAHLTGWPVKIMLGLLIAAFAVWGIGDVFRGGLSGDRVAQVGSVSVSTAEVQRAFEDNYRQLQQRFGSQLDRRQAIQLGLMQQSLQQLVAEHLVSAHAQDLDLAVADRMLATRLQDDPTFRGANGAFDRERVGLMARSLGMTEDGYIDTVRDEMLRRELLSGITAPIAAPDVLARQLWLRDNEKRAGRALIVLASAVAVGEPDEAALTTYLEDHKTNYQRPELRKLTLAQLRPADFADEQQVSDDEIRAEYDARIADFRIPEQREVTQLLAPDEATARQAGELIKSGKTMEQVGTELGSKVTIQSLGAMRRDQLPAELADPIYKLVSKGDVSEPARSAFGWHVFRLEGIVPEVTVPFEGKRAELEHELKLRKAAEVLPDLVNQLEDAIAGGASLEDAAQQAGASTRTIESIDSQGAGPDGKSLLGDDLTKEIVDTGFSTGDGEVSPVKDTPDGGYYVLRVDKVEPAQTKPLEEVRDELVTAWKADQQVQGAEKLAKELLTRAQAGESLETLQQATAGTELKPIAPITRSDAGTDAGLDASAVELLFATEPGKVGDRVITVPSGAALIATDRIERGEPPAELDELKGQLAFDLRGDLLAEYETALRERYQPTVNERLLQQLTQTDEG